MPFNPDWLADVHSSPYAEQLARGYRRLRFAPSLEREYRDYQLRDTLELRRLAVCVAMLVWLAFAGVDIWMIDGPLLFALLAIRLGVALLLLFCGRLILRRSHRELLVPLSIACIGAMGLGAAAIIALGHGQDPFFPYEGLLLVCIAAYFLVGAAGAAGGVVCAATSAGVGICWVPIAGSSSFTPSGAFCAHHRSMAGCFSSDPSRADTRAFAVSASTSSTVISSTPTRAANSARAAGSPRVRTIHTSPSSCVRAPSSITDRSFRAVASDPTDARMSSRSMTRSPSRRFSRTSVDFPAPGGPHTSRTVTTPPSASA